MSAWAAAKTCDAVFRCLHAGVSADGGPSKRLVGGIGGEDARGHDGGVSSVELDRVAGDLEFVDVNFRGDNDDASVIGIVHAHLDNGQARLAPQDEGDGVVSIARDGRSNGGNDGDGGAGVPVKDFGVGHGLGGKAD